MIVLWRSPGVTEHELAIYLRDAIRSESMLTAETITLGIPIWRGTNSPVNSAPIQSWASRFDVALTFGSNVHMTNLINCLAIVSHDDGWIEYICRRPESGQTA